MRPKINTNTVAKLKRLEKNRHEEERKIANLPIAKVVMGSSFHCNMTGSWINVERKRTWCYDKKLLHHDGEEETE